MEKAGSALGGSQGDKSLFSRENITEIWRQVAMIASWDDWLQN